MITVSSGWVELNVFLKLSLDTPVEGTLQDTTVPKSVEFYTKKLLPETTFQQASEY